MKLQAFGKFQSFALISALHCAGLFWGRAEHTSSLSTSSLFLPKQSTDQNWVSDRFEDVLSHNFRFLLGCQAGSFSCLFYAIIPQKYYGAWCRAEPLIFPSIHHHLIQHTTSRETHKTHFTHYFCSLVRSVSYNGLTRTATVYPDHPQWRYENRRSRNMTCCEREANEENTLTFQNFPNNFEDNFLCGSEASLAQHFVLM